MPRIRTVKPEFWGSEDVWSLSRDARLMFIGLWNFADDEGIGNGNPKQIKVWIFPGDDDVGPAEIADWLAELATRDLITRYKAGGRAYYQIVNWKAHQRIDRPRPSKYPKPNDSTSARGVIDEPSTGARAPSSPLPSDPLPSGPPKILTWVSVWGMYAGKTGAQGDAHYHRQACESIHRSAGGDFAKIEAVMDRWLKAKGGTPAIKWLAQDWDQYTSPPPASRDEREELEREWSRRVRAWRGDLSAYQPGADGHEHRDRLLARLKAINEVGAKIGKLVPDDISKLGPA